MKNLLITIKELKAINYSRKDDSFNIVVNFNVNDEQKSITKNFKMEKRTEVLSHELVKGVKNYVKDNNKSSLADDFFDSITIIRYNDVEEVEEKVSNFFKKFNDSIKDYKTRQYSEGFLNTYRTPNGFSMKIN